MRNVFGAAAVRLLSCKGLLAAACLPGLWLRASSQNRWQRNAMAEHAAEQASLLNPDGYADDQYAPAMKTMMLQRRPLMRTGCGVMAVYNGLRACGKPITLARAAFLCEQANAVMGAGRFGCNPYRLHRVFEAAGLQIVTLTPGVQPPPQAQALVLAYWNDAHRPGAQMHFVTLVWHGGADAGWYVLNGGSPRQLPSLVTFWASRPGVKPVVSLALWA